ncbi:MAG: Spy/CpxP family protein refolding chaperone [Terriglobia bacterium]
MKARILLLGFSLFLVAAPARAQHRTPRPAQRDPIRESLFPPELVMRHQRAIGLEPEQKAYIRKQMRQAQLRFTELQWELEDAAETMRSLLEQDQVDEEQVLGQLEKVLDAERRIKRLQLSLMIRIKNKLTPEQQAQLRELRPSVPPAPPAPPKPPKPPASQLPPY